MPDLYTTVLPLASFAFVMSITPGPNNLMLLSSGARFGLRLSLAHLLGVATGFLGLLLVCWFGVGAVVLADPRIGSLLTAVCVLYLCWLAWLLVSDSGESPADAPAEQPDAAGRSAAQPMSWFAAFAFQFVNPKAWGMGVTAVSIVRAAPLSMPAKLAVLLAVCSAVNLPCVALWTVCGAAMRQHLRRPWIRRGFHGAMALCVVATALWMLGPLLSARGHAG